MRYAVQGAGRVQGGGNVDLRGSVLTAVVSAVLGLAACAPEARAAGKPNVIIITVDDLGWTDLACFGSKYYETPNIDRLAAQGMRFTDAYAACAVCSPTRAAIVTGRYPARIGITDWIRSRFQGGRITGGKNPSGWKKGRDGLLCPQNHMFLEHEDVTIAEVLKPLGYVSCHIGKWHLGTDDWYPERQGFDLNFGGCDYGQPPSYFDPYRNRKCPNIPTLKARKEGEYLTDREADEAVGFIRSNSKRPFYLSLCNYAVHTPIQARKDIKAKYDAKPKTNQKNAAYAAMVESVDHAVGRIMTTLDELGLARKTLVIFTSDNGGLLGPTHNAPLRSGKGYPYEGGIRIPQIVRWPGVVEAGSVCRTPVTSVDFLPTVVEATGARAPRREIDGESLMPLLNQRGSLKRDSIFWHFPHFRGRIVPYSIIRSGKWKLIKRYTGKPFELFNLEDDISEKRDLAAEMPGIVKELDAKLVAWLKHTGAKVPRRQ
jgi:arylsulfatase A-like enzyme